VFIYKRAYHTTEHESFQKAFSKNIFKKNFGQNRAARGIKKVSVFRIQDQQERGKDACD